MPRLFLYQIWLAGAVQAMMTSPTPLTLKGKPIGLSPRQYAAALMQAYFGNNPLSWIAEIMGLSEQTLRDWRREPGFLLVMDWSKVQFAEFFREKLVSMDFAFAEYFDIAGECALLEDSLRTRARTQLYEIFLPLGEKLASRRKHGLPLEAYDLTLFRRLFLFFLALEHYWPSSMARRLKERFIPLAREVVWPALGAEPWPPEFDPAGRIGLALPDIREILAAKLSESLAELRVLH
ncbi:MAG: hypothetical protein QME75_15245 [Deltaproteobacteria bacterium]|nr:hypothetical protein [Deltaproteobacteria bacterium]